MREGTTGPGRTGSTDRRRFLRALGALGIAGLAGCGGDGGGTPTATTEPADATERPGETDTPTPAGPPTETPTATATATPTPGQSFGDDPRPLLSLSGEGSVRPGETTTLSGELVNAYLFPVQSVSVTLEPPDDGWEITPTGETSFEEIPSQGREEVGWEIAVPDDADGEYTIAGTVAYESATDAAEVDVSRTLLVLTAGEAPQEGLEAYFPLDGDTATNEVTGMDATVYGDPSTGTAGATGETGQAVSFDGEDDALASAGELAIDGDAATIAGWIRFTGESIEEWTRLFTVAPDPTTPFNEAAGYQVFYQAGGLWMVAFNAAGENVVVTDSLGNFIEPGSWYFVAFTIDEGAYTMYAYDADGAISGFPTEISGDTRNKSETQHLVLSAGTDDFGTTYFAACDMDEVRAYSRPLSESEMFRLYTGSGGSG